MTRDGRDMLLTAPAWLVSLLLHLILLTILGLLSFPSETPITGIRLSTAVSPRVREGARVQVEPSDEPQFDLPVPETERSEDETHRKALILADQDARQLREDPAASEPRVPLPEIRRMIGTEDIRRTFAVRDPRVRVELVKREGGTTWTEAAVARGLRWMAKHQRPDGSWSLDRFSLAADCRGRCDGTGHVRSDSAATSLCLLPFLGAGQTHQQGIYRDVVAQGLHWLITHQDVDGDLRIDSQRNAGMYAHGQGAIVLCEAYAMTRDEQLRGPAQAAIDFIVAAQHRAGGWRYQPGEDGDTSVLGWQLMALQSARVAGLRVPQNTWRRAQRYLNRALTADGMSYAYRPGEGPSHVMTAEALLCRMYMGQPLDDPALRAGLNQLVRHHPPRTDEPNVYYWYYATQALHHAGGAMWEHWNLQLRDVLVQTQRTNGHAAGSWDPRGPHAFAGGRLYVTALAICTLEVYYRHAPIFRRITL
jgi:hypothetical protein